MHMRRQYAHCRITHIHKGAFAFAEVCTDCLLVRSNRHEAWGMHAQLTSTGENIRCADLASVCYPARTNWQLKHRLSKLTAHKLSGGSGMQGMKREEIRDTRRPEHWTRVLFDTCVTNETRPDNQTVPAKLRVPE
jgi:hypothetical protein